MLFRARGVADFFVMIAISAVAGGTVLDGGGDGLIVGGKAFGW